MPDPMTTERLAEIEAHYPQPGSLYAELVGGTLGWRALDDVPALLAEVRRLQEATERVRALHHRVEVGVIMSDCAWEECDHETACPEVPFAVCDACYSIADQIDPYLYERGGVDVVAWPCPTIAALDGES